MSGLSHSTCQRIVKSENFSKISDDIEAIRTANELVISKDMLNHMLMQAWDQRGDTTEAVKVVHELAVINDLIPGAKKTNTTNVAIQTVVNPNGEVEARTYDGKVQKLSDAELAQLAGSRYVKAMRLPQKKMKEVKEFQTLEYDDELDIHKPAFGK